MKQLSLDTSGRWWQCEAGHRNELGAWAAGKTLSWQKCETCRDGAYWRIEQGETDG